MAGKPKIKIKRIPTKRQARAYILVIINGQSMAVAGRIMGGISPQAVFGLIKRFKKNCQRPEDGEKRILRKNVNYKRIL